MATAQLKPGEKPVTGIYCGMRYIATKNGKQSVFGLPIPDAKQARRDPAYRATRIIALCVIDIQRRMHSTEEAMKQYRAIKARVMRDYKRYHELEHNDNKLQQAIVDGYFQDLRKRPSKRMPEPELGLT